MQYRIDQGLLNPAKNLQSFVILIVLLWLIVSKNVKKEGLLVGGNFANRLSA